MLPHTWSQINLDSIWRNLVEIIERDLKEMIEIILIGIVLVHILHECTEYMYVCMHVIM